MADQHGRRALLALACAALVGFGLVAGCSAKKAPPAKEPPADTVPPPPAVESPPPAPELAGAIAVMIENTPEARPQAGLDKADIVYEMEAEGGITRFLALFYGHKADKVGPVRSARVGFYEVALSYGIPYAHAGGNYDVLALLRRGNPGILNVDEINGSGPSFWRSTDRTAPHNLYTSTDRIINRARQAGFALHALPTFPEGQAPAGGKAVSEVSFNWGPRSQVATWAWDGKRYQRSQPDGPHTVEGGGRVETENLVLLFTTYVWDGKAQDGEGENHIKIVGSGNGYLYRGGQAFPITWSKGAASEPYRLTTAGGAAVSMARGRVWVEVLKTPDHVTKGLPE